MPVNGLRSTREGRVTCAYDSASRSAIQVQQLPSGSVRHPGRVSADACIAPYSVIGHSGRHHAWRLRDSDGLDSAESRPEAIELQMTPTVIYAGQQAELLVRSPGADSIVIQSENGLDRYWSSDSVLRVALASDFGDPAPAERYAPEWKGRTLPYLKKPVHVTACRQGHCREFYHEIAVKLPEQNRRVVAVTAGWSSVFARRSIRDGRRTVLFQDALTSGAWSLQGEWSAGGWNGKVQGLLGSDDRGFWFDLSRGAEGRRRDELRPRDARRRYPERVAGRWQQPTSRKQDRVPRRDRAQHHGEGDHG